MSSTLRMFADLKLKDKIYIVNTSYGGIPEITERLVTGVTYGKNGDTVNIYLNYQQVVSINAKPNDTEHEIYYTERWVAEVKLKELISKKIEEEAKKMEDSLKRIQELKEGMMQL